MAINDTYSKPFQGSENEIVLELGPVPSAGTSPEVSLPSIGQAQARMERVKEAIIAKHPDIFKGYQIRLHLDASPDNKGAKTSGRGRSCDISFGLRLFGSSSDIYATQNDDELGTVEAHEFGHCLARDHVAQAKLLKSLGLTQSHIDRIARGQFLPTVNQLKAIISARQQRENNADRIASLLIKDVYDLNKGLEYYKRQANKEKADLTRLHRTVADLEAVSTHPAWQSRVSLMTSSLPSLNSLSDSALHGALLAIRGPEPKLRDTFENSEYVIYDSLWTAYPSAVPEQCNPIQLTKIQKLPPLTHTVPAWAALYSVGPHEQDLTPTEAMKLCAAGKEVQAVAKTGSKKGSEEIYRFRITPSQEYIETVSLLGFQEPESSPQKEALEKRVSHIVKVYSSGERKVLKVPEQCQADQLNKISSEVTPPPPHTKEVLLTAPTSIARRVCTEKVFYGSTVVGVKAVEKVRAGYYRYKVYELEAGEKLLKGKIVRAPREKNLLGLPDNDALGSLSGATVGQAYGAGSLGLIGSGRGNGGTGEGTIGLGNLGTIGNGGGSGVGSGYGRGAGRLGAERSSASEIVPFHLELFKTSKEEKPLKSNKTK